MLEFLYRMIECSIPLLKFAIPISDGDLKEYYKHHLKEETGHDLVLLDDLKRCGVEKEDIHFFPDVAELIGMQYYLIAHKGPYALLGYMSALERENPTEEIILSIESALGTEMKCMRLHSKLDIDHIKEIDMEIAKLSPEQRRIVEFNESYTKQKLITGLSELRYV